jgi:hypothetical protein
MQGHVSSRVLPEVGMVLGVALAIGCGRTEMETLARAAGSGGADASSSRAEDAASGPCGGATCLASLFQTCVPEGSCSVQSSESAGTYFTIVCYANGVTVSQVESDGATEMTGDLTVRRDGALCYSIASSTPVNSNGTVYVVRNANGEQVATGALVKKDGTVTVTCNGGQPTPVSSACLLPIGYHRACAPGICP